MRTEQLAERINQLESTVRQLTAEIGVRRARDAVTGSNLPFRMAKTASSGATYPTEVSNPTVYPIVFTDASYPRTQGTQVLSQVNRQTVAQEWAYFSGDYLAEGTPVAVAHDGAQWYVLNGTYSGSPAEPPGDVVRVLRINGSGGIATCEPVAHISGEADVWDGRVMEHVGGVWSDVSPATDVWLMVVNHCDVPTTLKKEERYVCLYIGERTFNSTARPAYVVYTPQEATPNTSKIVRVDASPGVTSCTNVNATSGVWDGQCVDYDTVAKTWSDSGAVWLVQVNQCDSLPTLKKEERYVGHALGSMTISGDSRAAYAVQPSSQLRVRLGKADAAIAVNSSGTVSIWENGADTTTNVTAYLSWAHRDLPIVAGEEVALAWIHTQASNVGRYEILPRTNPFRLLKAVTDGTIAAGSGGTVSVYSGASDTGTNVIAYLNWIHGGESISGGKRVLIAWFADEAKWVIISADCET